MESEHNSPVKRGSLDCSLLLYLTFPFASTTITCFVSNNMSNKMLETAKIYSGDVTLTAENHNIKGFYHVIRQRESDCIQVG